MSKKPNIISFITHDQGQFVGCYDTPQMPNSLYTPNLDELASKGVRFTNYFCTAPQCSPSRGSIQTSLYPHQNGLMGLVNRGWTLPIENKTLPMYLKENGYSTHLIGLQHESLKPSDLGYDTLSERFFHKDLEIDFMYNCKLVEDECLKFFQKYKDDDNPFYLNIGVEEVHRPFKSWGEPADPKSVKVPPFLPDNEIFRKELADYYGAINSVDITIGKIIKMLEETDLKKNTLFIFTTDHGIPFPRAKATLYDPGLKTSLIMYQPDSELFEGGKVFDSLLSNLDYLPTLLDFIGVKIPAEIEGKSFLTILRGEKSQVRTEIYGEKTYHDIYDPMRGIRTHNYKYIKNFEDIDTQYVLPIPMAMAPTGKFLKDKINKPRAKEELYDLQKDPNERSNLINNPEYEEIANNLRKKLEDWMIRTKDPLLKGKVKPQNQEAYDKDLKKRKKLKNL
jgi:arylsulfatase A-like enzyme